MTEQQEQQAAANMVAEGSPARAETIEQEIQRKGLTAPRVTPARINDLVSAASVQFFVFPGTTVTVCCVQLLNGVTLVGESACASPDNFNRELGERIALDNAKAKLWPLEGYLLREQLHRSAGVGEVATDER